MRWLLVTVVTNEKLTIEPENEMTPSQAQMLLAEMNAAPKVGTMLRVLMAGPSAPVTYAGLLRQMADALDAAPRHPLNRPSSVAPIHPPE